MFSRLPAKPIIIAAIALLVFVIVLLLVDNSSPSITASKEYLAVKQLNDVEAMKEFVENADNDIDRAMGSFRVGLLLEKEDIETSYSYYLDALNLYFELKDAKRVGWCFDNLGKLHYISSNFEDALKFYDRATSVSDDEFFIQRVSIMKGKCYWHLEQIDKSLEILLESQEYFKGRDDFQYSEASLILGNISYDYAKINNDYKYYDQAYGHYIDAETGYKDTRYEAHIVNNKANIKLAYEKYDEAEAMLNQALAMHEDSTEKATTYFLLGNLALARSQPEKSFELYKHSLALNSSWNYEFEESFNKLIMMSFENNENKQAQILYQEQYSRSSEFHRIKDELHKKEISNRFHLVEQINLLKQELNKQNTHLLLILCVFVVIAFIVAFTLFRYRSLREKRNKKLLDTFSNL